MNRKLRFGMIGGGKDAFIGAVHRIATNMDGLIDESEWGGSPEAFNSIDTDFDGILTPEEVGMGVGPSFSKLASRRAPKYASYQRRASQDQYLSPEEVADILGGTLISKGRR